MQYSRSPRGYGAGHYRLFVVSLMALALALLWRADFAYAAAADSAAHADAVLVQQDGGDDSGGDNSGPDDGSSDDKSGDHSGSDDNGSDDSSSDGSGDDHGGEDDDIKRYGRLESRPNGTMTGTWRIGGTDYTATETTQFKREYGEFRQNGCVEVEIKQSSPTVAHEIGTEEDYKCSGRSGEDDDSAEGELYGLISKMPDGALVGTWIIGGRVFSATQTTKFDQEDGRFGPNVLVKVEFYTLTNGTHVAKEIEVKYGSGHHSDDERSYGDDLRDDAKAYGVIDERPQGTVVGKWIISSVAYSVTERTEVDNGGNLAEGQRVKVEYVVLSNGILRATEIEASDDGGVSRSEHAKLVGFVDKKPEPGFIGEWEIGGTLFVADLSTIFKEDDGIAFAKDAYVEVEYVVEGGVNRIIEIETHVPPGAGDDSSLGKIENVGGTSGMSAMTAANGPWIIGGEPYTVGPFTQLVASSGPLIPGTEVFVNSYTSGNGEQVATLVRSVTLVPQVYLPLMTR